MTTPDTWPMIVLDRAGRARLYQFYWPTAAARAWSAGEPAYYLSFDEFEARLDAGRIALSEDPDSNVLIVCDRDDDGYDPVVVVPSRWIPRPSESDLEQAAAAGVDDALARIFETTDGGTR